MRNCTKWPSSINLRDEESYDQPGRHAGKAHGEQEVFVSADITGYDVFLGYPCLQGNNPDIRWKDGSWRLRSEPGAESAPVLLEELEEFLRLASEERSIIYGAWIAHKERDPDDRTTTDTPPLHLFGAEEAQIPLE